MEQPLLTVVVAVYKTEEFLARCIDSLLASEYRNLEILLIDDGSPDRCPQICEEYAAKDERIRVIHKENGGSYSAKNLGISAARGAYTAFCDSDDRVPPDAYRILMENAARTEADAVRGVVKRIYSDTGEARLFYRSREDSFMTKCIGFQGAVYRTGMLKEHDILHGAFRLGEDMCFMAQVVRYAKNVQYLDAVTYEYLIRPTGSSEASAMQKKKHFLYYYDDFRWRNWILDYVDSHEDMKEQYGGQLAVFCKIIDESWLDYSVEEREKCFTELKRMVGLIDWKRANANAKGYLQIAPEKLQKMNEKAFSAYLKRQYRLVKPVKQKIKKLLGR